MQGHKINDSQTLNFVRLLCLRELLQLTNILD